MTKKIINDIAYKIVGCAIEVNKELGPGLVEKVYECCMIEELNSKGLIVRSQVSFPINYKGKILDTGLRIDLIVDENIIVELKAVEKIIPIHEAQLLTYLKLTRIPKGLIINFNCKNITNELKSLVTDEFAKLPDE
jgi:GxxExxY protein